MGISLKAYAKLNLGLDVIGKRQDGYHLLETIMQSIDLYDIVRVCRTKKSGIDVECRGLSIPNQKNIAYKAATVFFNEIGYKSSYGVRIKIKKNIPSQAGMGGGSSDAAATIIALNKLFKTKLSQKELCAIGEKVGADVPFCICGGTMLVRGIGEVLTRLDDCPKLYFVVAKGSDGVSTKEAYEAVDSAQNRNELRTQKVIELISESRLNELKGMLVNTFEECTYIKDVFDIKQIMLENGACEAAMTGSGSAVFGIFKNKKSAIQCKKTLKAKYPFACVSKPASLGVK